jgi:hypothetical protein
VIGLAKDPQTVDRDRAHVAALGCRAHTGWAAVVAVAGSLDEPRVLLRRRVDLSDPTGQVRRNVYQAARGVDPVAARGLVEAAERTARDQATAVLGQALRDVPADAAAVRACAVVVGAFPSRARLESILASHALAHAAEGRLYQQALLRGAEAHGLQTLPVPRRSIWALGGSALGIGSEELRCWIDRLRREVGPPWAEDQKLAAVAAWIALTSSR